MLTQSLKQSTYLSLLLLSSALVAAPQANAANFESRTVMQNDTATVVISRNDQGVRMSSSDGDLFSVRVQNREQILVSINGVRQVYPIALLEQGRTTFSAEYQAEYHQLWESEAGDILGIPEDPDALFGISFWEAVGCGAGGGLIGAATAGWGGALAGAACLAYFNDHSIELD